jgi:hypothetical protein
MSGSASRLRGGSIKHADNFEVIARLVTGGRKSYKQSGVAGLATASKNARGVLNAFARSLS